MKKRILLTVALVAAWAAVIRWVDPYLVRVLGLIAVSWIGIPTVLVASMLWLRAVRAGRSRRTPTMLLKSVFGLVAVVGFTLAVNYLIQLRAVSLAKAFPALVAPELEAFRQLHGSYPLSLEQLPSKPALPRLLRRFGYRPEAQSYSFLFAQPGTLLDTWTYDSHTHTWQH